MAKVDELTLMLPLASTEQHQFQNLWNGQSVTQSSPGIPPCFSALGLSGYPFGLAAHLRQARFSDAADDHWGYVSLIRQQADLNGIVMTGLGFDLEPEPWQLADDNVRPLLEGFASEIEADPGNGWWVRSAQPFGFSAPPPHRLAGAMLDQFVGRDEAHKNWRVLCGEVEMALFQAGRPGGLNGIWLWGCGHLTEVQAADTAVYSADPDLSRLGAAGLPGSFEAMCDSVSASHCAVVELTAAQQSSLSRDWLAPSISALNTRQLKHLQLYFNDAASLHVGSAKQSLFRRWFPWLR